MEEVHYWVIHRIPSQADLHQPICQDCAGCFQDIGSLLLLGSRKLPEFQHEKL